MKIQLPNGVRYVISKYWLDMVETLPKFQGGVIAHLQHIRETQRNWAKRVYDKTRPIEGSEIELLAFQMYEMFNVEDFHSIQPRLFHLFPEADNEEKNSFFSSSGNNLITDSLQKGWIQIGIIARKRDNLFAPIVRYMPDLPEEISFLELQIHKISPVIILLTINVHLTEKVNKEIKTRHNQQYLSEIRFTHTLPFNIRKTGYISTGSKDVMKREVFHTINKIQSSIEMRLKPFINGFFMQQDTNKGPKLPITKIYALHGVPEDTQDFKDWKSKAEPWLDSMDVNMLNGLFTNHSHILSINHFNSFLDYRTRQDRDAFQIFIRWETFIKSTNLNMFSDKTYGAIYITTEYLNEIIPLITLFHFVETIRIDIDDISQTVLAKKRSTKSLRKYVDASRRIQEKHILLDRIFSDFNSWKDRYQNNNDLDMKLSSRIWEDKIEVYLFNHLIFVIENRLNLCTKQLKYIRESLSDQLTLKNIASSYRLQWIAIILTAVAVILSSISLIDLWPNVENLVEDISTFLSTTSSIPTSDPIDTR